MGRFARIFRTFTSFLLVSLPQTSLSQKRHVKRPVRHTENEFGPCKSPGASLLRQEGVRGGSRAVNNGSPKKHFSGITGRHSSRTPLAQPPARQRGAVSRFWPGGALLHAVFDARRPAQRPRLAANPSAAPHRWRLGDDSPLDSADQRQITSTERACGPPARSRY